MANKEAWTISEILTALDEGNKPFVPGGYHTKDDLRSIREELTKRAGCEIKVRYTGESTHRYFFEKA